MAAVHATTKLFGPFCSAEDSETADMNCLVFKHIVKRAETLSL